MTIRLGAVALLVAWILLPASAFAVDATKPSIRILSPNGGESFEVKSNKKLSVSWEATNMPSKAKICIGVVLEDHASAYRTLALGDLSLANTFECVPVKNGKGKVAEKMLEVYSDVHSSPGEYAIVATVITETPFNGIDYLGRPYSSSKIDKIANDVSDKAFTIKPFTDKKAGMLEVFEGTEQWEGGVMYEKDAVRECQNIGFGDTTLVRCVWKGKEIYNNTPKDGRKLYAFAYNATVQVGQKLVSTASAAKKFCSQNVAKYGSVTSCQWGNTMIKKSGEEITLSVKEDKKKTEKTETTTSAEEKAAKAIRDAEQEIDEVREEAARAADQAIGLAVLAIAQSLLDDAKEYYEDGNWSYAEGRARQAEDKAYEAGRYF